MNQVQILYDKKIQVTNRKVNIIRLEKEINKLKLDLIYYTNAILKVPEVEKNNKNSVYNYEKAILLTKKLLAEKTFTINRLIKLNSTSVD